MYIPFGGGILYRKITAFLLIITTLLTLCSCFGGEEIHKLDVELTGDLNVHFIDVGQGDCTLLESDGKFVLIDAGEKEYENTVCAYLKENGVKTIDYVIATHPHSDHCGGLTMVIDTFDCKNFITVETDQRTNVWMSVLRAVDKNDVNYIDAKVSDTYTFGESQFEIMGPYGNDYGDNYNNYSVVIKASCGDTSFLFTGDAEALAESEMIENGAELEADVLKVGHHGSSTSNSNAFLSAVRPKCAVISCGKDNEYGHPHKEILNALKRRGTTVFRTDELSTIIASSDKKQVRFYYKTTDKISEQVMSDNSNKISYVGNKNSKKFHFADCDGAKSMNKSNKVEFDSREDAVSKGYTPCKTCKP